MHKIKKCIHCGQEFICSRTKEFINRKYCSKSCMYSDEEYIKHQKEACRNNRPNWKAIAEGHKRAHEKRRARTKWRSANKDLVDITLRDLDKYRALHPVCEICGRENGTLNNKKKKLCVDHDHKTLKFRGLLCSQCNRSLGWLENNRKEIELYLNKK